MEKILDALKIVAKSTLKKQDVDFSFFNSFSRKDWQEFYSLTKFHDIAHIVGDFVIKNNITIDEDIKKNFQKAMFMAVRRFQQFESKLQHIKSLFIENNIPFIVLKGSFIRRYYAKPWYRTSCDMDILVKEEYHKKARELIESNLNSRNITATLHDYGYMIDNFVNLELHYKLFCDNDKRNAILDDIWNKAVTVNETSEYQLPNELFFYYHVLHMSKHLMAGCGIRPFFDLWILKNISENNNQKNLELITKGGLLDLYNAYENIVDYIFNDGKLTENSKLLFDYILTGGSGGTLANFAIFKSLKSKNRVKYYLKRLFIPYDKLTTMYPSVKGKKILVPFYQVRRWFRLLKPKAFNRCVKEMKILSNYEEERKRIEQLIKIFKL